MLRPISCSLIFSLFLGVPESGEACSNFSVKSETESLHGQNYDWDADSGYVLFNPSGKIKKGLGPQPADWTSSYASLTVNQYGLEFPIGGTNEKGLTIGVMWLNETEFSSGETDKSIMEPLQWVQYQLDQYATVSEVLANLQDTEIRPVFGPPCPLHYLVSDRDGNACVVTIRNGVTVAYSEEELPHSVLTNTPYDVCRNEAGNYQPFGGDGVIGRSYSSVDRFLRAARFAEDFPEIPKEDGVSKVFATLENIRQSDYTKWSVVYDKESGSLSWRTLRSPLIKTVAFDDFEDDCSTGVMSLNMNQNLSGTVADDFIVHESRINLELIRRSFSQTTRTNVMAPDRMLMNLAGFPYTFECKSDSGQETMESGSPVSEP